eukprot:318167_1
MKNTSAVLLLLATTAVAQSSSEDYTNGEVYTHDFEDSSDDYNDYEEEGEYDSRRLRGSRRPGRRPGGRRPDKHARINGIPGTPNVLPPGMVNNYCPVGTMCQIWSGTCFAGSSCPSGTVCNSWSGACIVW